MISLGLSSAEQKLYHQSLVTDHELRVIVRVLTLDHVVVGELTGHVLAGQVDVDTTQAVHRTASVSLLDPDNRLGIDTDTPQSAGAMASRMLQVYRGTRSVLLDRWVDVPVFTGPIDTTDRDGDVVTITAHGKEVLALDPGCMNLVQRKGATKTRVIEAMLRAAGETRMAITPRSDKITTNFVIAAQEPIWPRVQKLAQSVTGGYTLEYDGRGTAVLKDTSTPVLWTFVGGDGGSLLGEPKFTADTSQVKNFVVVTGGVPKGAKRHIVATATTQRKHPFSPWSLGRNGHPRYLREDIANDEITVKEVAQTLANDRLWELEQVSTEASWESLVIPHLEPYDQVRVVGEQFTFSTAARKFTIPLTSDGRMTHGKHWQRRTVNRFTASRLKNPRIPKPVKAPVKPKTSKAQPKKTTARKATK